MIKNLLAIFAVLVTISGLGYLWKAYQPIPAPIYTLTNPTTFTHIASKYPIVLIACDGTETHLNEEHLQIVADEYHGQMAIFKAKPGQVVPASPDPYYIINFDSGINKFTLNGPFILHALLSNKLKPEDFK